MHTAAAAILLIFALAAHAQTTIVSLFLYDTDPQPLVASVVAVESSTTTYSIACPTGTDSSDCGYPAGVDTLVTQAPNFAGANIDMAGQFTMNWSCDITSSTVAAVCTVSAGGPAANSPGVETTTLSSTDVQYFPVTVTAGLDKLTANLTPTSSGSMGATQTQSTGSQSTAGSNSNSGSTDAATSTNGSPPSPTANNNAASKITSNSILLVAISMLLGILM